MMLILLLSLIVASASVASAQSSFYKGQAITVIAGANAGSTYDLYVRLMARHMGKYIPGNPNFIVQNMGGAGSIIGANYVYNVAKPDGLSIGAVQPAIYFHQLLKQKEIKFDWARFTWIGSTDKTDQMVYIRTDVGHKTLADVRKAKEPPRCGATAAGTSGVYILKLLEETLRTKFNIVSGYQGVRDIDLAVERGELHCRAMTTAAYLAREPYHTWRKKGFARVLVQTGKNRDPQFSDVPTIYELMDEHKTREKDRQLLTMILAATDFGRPIIAPPGVPADKTNILREAFMKAMLDPELLADAKKQNLDITPTSGEELEDLAKRIIASQEPEIVERVKKLLGE
jgi:tripartite-type tricarboxylate transporter receptor subunit TctC